MLSTEMICTGWGNVSRLNVFSPLYFESGPCDILTFSGTCVSGTAQGICCLMQNQSGSQQAQITILNHGSFFFFSP